MINLLGKSVPAATTVSEVGDAAGAQGSAASSATAQLTQPDQIIG
jgi:hypothetical protein